MEIEAKVKLTEKEEKEVLEKMQSICTAICVDMPVTRSDVYYKKPFIDLSQQPMVRIREQTEYSKDKSLSEWDSFYANRQPDYFLTIKEKHIVDGVEVNKEEERHIADRDDASWLLQQLGWAPYYGKVKTVVAAGYVGPVHVEVVKVHGSCWLECEMLEDKPLYVLSDCFESFHQGFWDRRDARSWKDIAEDLTQNR